MFLCKAENSIDRLLGQNQQAARDIEMGVTIQLQSEGLAGFVSTQVEINKAVVSRLDVMQDDITEIRGDITKIRNDMGQVKGSHARAEVIAKAQIVAMDLGFDCLLHLSPAELYRLSKAAPADTDPNTLRSFQYAALVIEAMDGAELVYLAVEISYTIDNSDVNRA